MSRGLGDVYKRQLQEARAGAPDLLAVQSAAVASVFSYPDGDEVLPIGGFTGTGPSPSLDQVRAAIAAGSSTSCSPSPPQTRASRGSHSTAGRSPTRPPPFHGFYCTPADAAP